MSLVQKADGRGTGLSSNPLQAFEQPPDPAHSVEQSAAATATEHDVGDETLQDELREDASFLSTASTPYFTHFWQDPANPRHTELYSVILQDPVQNWDMAKQCLLECAKEEIGVCPDVDADVECEDVAAWWYLDKLSQLEVKELARVWAKSMAWTPNDEHFMHDAHDKEELAGEVHQWTYWRLRFLCPEYIHFEARRHPELVVFGCRPGQKVQIA